MALYCWGSTINGVLGIGEVEEEHIVIPHEFDWTSAENLKFISCGSTHSLMLTDDGKLFSCGQNDFGQLGHQILNKRPHLVNGFENHVITKACCGSSHSVALNEWGNVFTWGSNRFSQLGSSTNKSEPLPILVKTLGTKHIVQIATGNHHNIALTNEGELFAWGLNHSGQCGLGKAERIPKPTKITSLNGIPIAFIACGGSHSFVISKSGAVFGFGKNSSGQLGVGNFVSCSYPVQVKPLRNIGVRYISAGENFTVFLTREGRILTCGSGNYGQTAHGNKSDVVLPRMVSEMMGLVCTQLVCGSNHCLAFIPSQGCIYSFGLGSSGQLGNRTANALLPQKVVGPWATPSRINILNAFNPTVGAKVSFVKSVFSGGNHSFAITSKKRDNLDDFRFNNEKTQIKRLTVELIEQCVKVGETDKVDLSLMSSIEIIFRSPSCMNGSFIHSKCERMYRSSENHGINIEIAKTSFDLIKTMKNESLNNVIWESITEQLLPNLAESPPDIEALRIYLLLPLYHKFTDMNIYPKLHTPFGQSFLRMSKIAQEVVLQWWAAMPLEYFEKLVTCFKNTVFHILKFELQLTAAGLIGFNIHLRTALNFLKFLFKINRSKRDEPVPCESFYVHELTDLVQLQNDFCGYKSSKNEHDVFLSKYPFVFDLPAKKLILQTDQALQMCTAVHGAQTEELIRMLFDRPVPSQSYITFKISRDRIVEDTIKETVKYKATDLKKPLNVIFKNEQGVDAGGVKKEFFMLLVQKLFSSEFGMFKSDDESQLIWFSDAPLEGEEVFKLVGKLVGLALYNFQIINLPFPLALYKKIFNEELKLDDLCELSPTIGNSLKSLLEYEGDDMEDVFDLTFEVTREAYENLETVALKEDGGNIRVSQTNKKEFVDLKIDHILNKSVEKQYEAFLDGFMQVCGDGGSVLCMFQAHELRDVLVGNENYDWDVFETNAKYQHGYSSSHQVIRLFWEVFHELPSEEKKKFLLFLSGSDRIPLEGMKAIPITIKLYNVGDEFLPVSHTCFNLLDLPRYKTKEKLKLKLLQAIQHNQHFSLA